DDRQRRWTALERWQSHLGPCRAMEGRVGPRRTAPSIPAASTTLPRRSRRGSSSSIPSPFPPLLLLGSDDGTFWCLDPGSHCLNAALDWFGQVTVSSGTAQGHGGVRSKDFAQLAGTGTGLSPRADSAS